MSINQTKIDAVNKAFDAVSSAAGELSTTSSPTDVANFNALVKTLATASAGLSQ